VESQRRKDMIGSQMRSIFEIGDLVRIKTPTQSDYVYATDQVYTVKEFDSTGWIVLTPFPGEGNVFKDHELEFVNEDIADWESDYYDSSASDDYQSETMLHPHDPKTCEECVVSQANPNMEDYKFLNDNHIPIELHENYWGGFDKSQAQNYNQALCNSIESAYQEATKGIDVSVPDPTFDLWNDYARFPSKYKVIPELMSAALNAALAAKMNGTLISAGITEVGTYGAIIYKKFLEELEK